MFDRQLYIVIASAQTAKNLIQANMRVTIPERM